LCKDLLSLSLNLVIKNCIQAVIVDDISDDNATFYERFIYKNILYHSCDYRRMYKRNNSIVQTISGNFLGIKHLVCIKNANGVKQYVILGIAFEILDETLCTISNDVSTNYSFIVRYTNNIVAHLPDNIIKKYIIIPYGLYLIIYFFIQKTLYIFIKNLPNKFPKITFFLT